MTASGQPVRFRDCTCPGSPHNGADGADDGDIVYLRDHLGFSAGAEVARMMAESIKAIDFRGFDLTAKPLALDLTAMIEAKAFEFLAPVYLREGPMAWNVVDESGPVPCTKDALSDLPYSQGLPIVDRCDELYSDEVASPLVQRTSIPSNGGRTGPASRSTPPRKRSSSPRLSPRNSSLQNGSAGKPSPVSP